MVVHYHRANMEVKVFVQAEVLFSLSPFPSFVCGIGRSKDYGH